MAEVGTHDYVKSQPIAGQTVNGSSGTVAADVVTQGFERLIVLARMTAGAANDLAVAVEAYENDGSTLFAMALPTDSSVAAALTGGVSRLIQSYRLCGIDKVSVIVTNGNVAAKVATVTCYLAD